MTTFPDLSGLSHFQQETNGKSLTLPIRGKNYTWTAGALPLAAALEIQALRVQALAVFEAQQAAEKTGEPLDTSKIVPRETMSDRDFERMLIGEEATTALSTDGVLLAEYNRVYHTLLAWHMYGEQAARTTWIGDEGDAVPPAEAASGSTKTGGSSKPTSPRKAPAGRKSSRVGTSSKPRSRPPTRST
ncbi:MAG: hypothetical protein M3443_19420 [Actinomycetota bacterium]|nr:hypothetical protein [Actinomycetota bacterium]